MVTDPLSIVSLYNSGNQVPYAGSDSVKEAYAELALPLIKHSEGTFLRSLDLNAAARVTDYHNSGTVVTWKGGATTDVTDWLRLRATRSRDIRAPNLYEQFGIQPGSSQTNILNTRNGQRGNLLSTDLLGNRHDGCPARRMVSLVI